MKAHIFHEDLPICDTMTKYVQFPKNITRTNKNIAYRNDTCRNVSNAISNESKNQRDYEMGEVIICRKYTKLENTHCI